MLVENFFLIAIAGFFVSSFIFFVIHKMMVIHSEKPKFKGGNIFWNYFRLIFSTECYITSAALELSLFEMYCSKCKKNYSHIFKTNSASGTLNFLGIWKWAWYERIQCFCGQTLNFVIDPNK